MLLADPAHMPKRLRGLLLHEPISGEHGQVGPTSRVVAQTGKGKMEHTETITPRESADLRGNPKTSVVHFEREIVGGGMWSAVRDRLTEVSPGTTLWKSGNEYRFSSLPMRLVGVSCPVSSASSRCSTWRTSRPSPSREGCPRSEGLICGRRSSSDRGWQPM
ncbi:SRPBCC family protein [Streptomyces sp. NPDC019224]|uniref:SRPBCC family protein n=1 Tax=Streptomyces sp. NPDC019224 TaxID=3154484 RepID=UPI0034036C36